LKTAYVNFFSGKSKFPNYKKKKGKNSFCVPQFVKIEDGKIYISKLKKLGGIKLVEHRPLQGKILFATFSKTPTNKYFVSITVEQTYNSKQPTNKEIGIDLGIKDLIITSDGSKFKNHKFTNKYAVRLKKAQQHLSRKQKGSNGFEKQRLKVALIHEKIHNCRLDNLHKISHKLVMNNDVVYIENLNVKGMLKNHKLAKSISDCSWSELKRQLQYKGDWDDTYIHEIFRFYPSSKTCSICGYIKQDLSLDIRHWTCPECGYLHDRDINAARNILLEGQRELSNKNSSAGTADYTNAENVRPSFIMKQGKSR
jgi:putative transposase